MIYWILCFGICAAAVVLLAVLRPGIGKIENALNVLISAGYDNAEIRYIHGGSGRKIILRKEMVGGVPQILLFTEELKLSEVEKHRLKDLVTMRELMTEKRRGKGDKQVEPLYLVIRPREQLIA